MSYAIVFSSRTGNTALLAQTIRDTLPGDCLYFGTPDSKALEAETVYVGFWTDKGSCDESIAQFLKTLTNQKVFLFGTAGFGGSPEYFEQILKRVSENLGENTQLVGSYMCQGKMPQESATAMKQWKKAPAALPCCKTSIRQFRIRTSRIWKTSKLPLQNNRFHCTKSHPRFMGMLFMYQ